MKLLQAEVDGAYTVVEIKLPVQLERRLQALGLSKGTDIRVLQKKQSGALIIKFRGTRFAVGRAIAENITVRK